MAKHRVQAIYERGDGTKEGKITINMDSRLAEGEEAEGCREIQSVC